MSDPAVFHNLPTTPDAAAEPRTAAALQAASLAAEARLRAQNAALLRLAKGDTLSGSDRGSPFRRITEESARTLNCARVSVWLHEKESAGILCADLFEQVANRHSAGQTLKAQQFPAYFKALETEDAIAAHDARTDPRTAEFKDVYLEPLDIHAMLDAPIRLGGRIVGVVCHEHVGSPRQWALDEQNFARSMADFAGLALEVEERRRTEEMLRDEYHSAEKLREIGEMLAAELDVEKLAQKITDAATSLVGAEFGSYFYSHTEATGDTCVLYTLAGAPIEAFSGFPNPRMTAVFGPTFRGEGIIRSDDITRDARYGQNAPYNGMPPGHLPVCSYLAVPVKSRTGEVLGGLFFGHSQQGMFTERHERHLTVVASQAAVAFDNARLFAAAQTEIARRREAEEALRDSEEKYRLFFEANPHPMWVYETDSFRFLAVNGAAVQTYGFSREEFMQMTILDIRPPEEAERIRLHTEEDKGGFSPASTWKHRRKDGTDFYAEVTSDILHFGGREARLALASDVTERLLGEAALRETEERFRQFAENLEQVVWIRSVEEDRILYVSPAYEKVWGTSCESLYADQYAWQQAIHPDDQERAFLLMAEQANGAYDVQYRIIRPDGAVRRIRDRGFAIRDMEGRVYRYAGIADDVTDALVMEEQLRQAQKMESIGQLAGGVAHDFNNILTAILGYGQLAKSRLPLDHPSRAYLDTVQSAAERATDLTRQLLAFARKQVVEPKRVDVNRAVADATNILRRLIGEHIDLQIVRSAAPAVVKIDPGQLQQVLMNLAVNARDAMPEGGRLLIETETITGRRLKEIGLNTGGAADPVNAYVRLRVTDTGCGMSDATKARIFEPFFTTKETGKGTGLGLATCFGIVEQHGGQIFVESAEGEGARFDVYLPLLTPEARGTARGTHPEETARPADCAGTILLVEDEPLVRDIASHTLRSRGYRILEAPNGKAALKILRESQEAIDLLVTDVVMPEMGGKALAEAARADRPDLKVLYMSGYTDGTIGPERDLGAGMAFLQKPFTPSGLDAKVRSLLEG